MKKLNFLKSIIDFIWIMSLITYPLIIISALMLLLDQDKFDIPIRFLNTAVDMSTIYGKIAITITVLNGGLLLYAISLFRKLLTNFKKRIIFDDETCHLLNLIGRVVICGAIINLITNFILKLSSAAFRIEFGNEPFLYLMTLGLFFTVLAEVFTIGKRLKEENELTI
jgi:hypothetical protein